MGIGTGLYNFFLFLHIFSAVIGFGGVALNGIYGAESKKRPGPGGLAIGEANLRVSEIAEKVIWSVPVWGVIVLILSDGVWKFSQLWVMLAILLYAAAITVSLTIMVPSAKKMNKLAAELVALGPPLAGGPPPGGPPPQVAEMEATGKKLGTFGPMLDIALAAIVLLMVFKPGL